MKTLIKAKNILLLVYSSLAAAAMLFLIYATFVQVFTRYIMNASATWTEESARFVFVWCTMLGAVIALDKGLHAGVTFISDRIKGKALKIYDVLSYLVILTVAMIMLVQGYELTMATTKMLSPAIRLPLSYLNASIAMSGFGMIVVVVCKILEELTASKERMMDEV